MRLIPITALYGLICIFEFIGPAARHYLNFTPRVESTKALTIGLSNAIIRRQQFIILPFSDSTFVNETMQGCLHFFDIRRHVNRITNINNALRVLANTLPIPGRFLIHCRTRCMVHHRTLLIVVNALKLRHAAIEDLGDLVPTIHILQAEFYHISHGKFKRIESTILVFTLNEMYSML